MKSLKLVGQKRTNIGKKETARLRKEGFVPCNLYGGKDNIEFYATYNDFTPLIYTGDFFAVDVEVEGDIRKALIREIQFHPVSDKILHVDFLELVPGKKVIADIPIKLTGLAVGVKNGGKLVQKLRTLKVKATPENLREFIELNVDDLELGKSLKVKSIPLEGMEVLISTSIPVASVDIPRALRGKKAGEEEAAGGKKK